MEDKTRRQVKATKAFCEATEEAGIEICSWEDMPGYKSFVDGEITEDQLGEQAAEEISQISKTFSKFTVVQKDETPAEKESAVRKKAKDASRIYKKACADSGKDLCFFKNFISWQDFVEGRIDDSALYEKAVEEVRQLLENPQV